MIFIIIGLIISVIALIITKTIKVLPFCAGVITFFSILQLDNYIINWALTDVTDYKNLLTVILWIVILSISFAVSLIMSVIVGAIVSVFTENI